MQLKKIKAGLYTTTTGSYTIEKDGRFWYAYNSKTGKSVVDCEDSFKNIRDSLELHIKNKGVIL